MNVMQTNITLLYSSSDCDVCLYMDKLKCDESYPHKLAAA